jgi:hypothetical protein
MTRVPPSEVPGFVSGDGLVRADEIIQ